MAGLYIHIPFCKQKCHYCDFHFAVSLRNKPAVLTAMKKELLLRKNSLQTPIETLYFGGGTPSILSTEEIGELLTDIKANYQFVPNPEITLEANPDDLTPHFLSSLKKQGFNRLSIGVQSFFDEDLQFMNRVHSAKEAKLAIKNALEIGFSNITIDLIYGVPGLTNEKWQQNLHTFLDLGIPHLSSYALTVEKNTALDYFIKTKKYPPLEEELAKQHFDILVRSLQKQNYQHYELSNFAKDGFISKHNTAYWQGKHYLGIGPSAHSFCGKTRSWNIANNSKYTKVLTQDKLPLETEVLSLSDQYNEYIMTGLRTMWGVDIAKITKQFGLKYSQYLVAQSQACLAKNSLVLTADNKLVVSKKAFFLIDGIIADLFWV